MSAKPQRKTEPGTAVRKDVFNAGGVLLEFLASPEEVGESICLIRGMMPPGVVVPLHRHEEPELLYVLEGSLEVYRSDGPSGGWMAARVGDIVVIPSNVKHALRNGSSVPATLALVTVRVFPRACKAVRSKSTTECPDTRGDSGVNGRGRKTRILDGLTRGERGHRHQSLSLDGMKKGGPIDLA